MTRSSFLKSLLVAPFAGFAARRAARKVITSGPWVVNQRGILTIAKLRKARQILMETEFVDGPLYWDEDGNGIDWVEAAEAGRQKEIHEAAISIGSSERPDEFP